jgi:hypothetical protein
MKHPDILPVIAFAWLLFLAFVFTFKMRLHR